jgi:hypothetical protein
MQNPRLNLNGWVFVQLPTFFLTFLIQIRNVLLGWSLPSSWLFWHSHILTNFFCVYHKFVWWCILNSIDSKCDFSKIVKFGVYIVTCVLMIRDLISHVSVHHSFKCVFNGKNKVPPHQIVCTIAWLKRRPNILVWSILHGLVHCVDHQNYRHNHTYKTYLW